MCANLLRTPCPSRSDSCLPQLPRGTAWARRRSRAAPAQPRTPAPLPGPVAAASMASPCPRTRTHIHTRIPNRHRKASPGSAPRPGPAAALPYPGEAQHPELPPSIPTTPLHPCSGSPRTPRASKYLPVHGRFSAIAAETVIRWIRLLRLAPSRCELEASQSCPGHFRIRSICLYFSPLSSDRGEGRGELEIPIRNSASSVPSHLHLNPTIRQAIEMIKRYFSSSASR